MFNRNTHMMLPPPPHTQADVINGGGGSETEFFFHQGAEFVCGHYLVNAPLLEAAGGAVVGGAESPFVAAEAQPRKRAAKTDRHSKINTAQGPRDRRVRLSIGIARKFFDLQEMLGFDKPSKTLDWLLTKSKSAIKELVQTKQKDAVLVSGVSPLSENDEEFPIGNPKVGQNSKGKSAAATDSDERRGSAAKDQANLTKESRAKARARARARTREKMLNQITRDPISTSDLNPILPIQYVNDQIHEVCRIPGSSSSPPPPPPPMMSRKTMMKFPQVWGFQNSGLISRDVGENWDINSFASSQPLYPILDQHKFINSSNSNG